MALVAIIFLAIILVSIILGRGLFFKTYSKLLIAALILLLSFLVLLFFTTIYSIDVLDNAKDYSKIVAIYKMQKIQKRSNQAIPNGIPLSDPFMILRSK